MKYLEYWEKMIETEKLENTGLESIVNPETEFDGPYFTSPENEDDLPEKLPENLIQAIRKLPRNSKYNIILNEEKGKSLLTSDAGGFEYELRVLSDGTMQADLNSECRIMLDEARLRKAFGEIGLEAYVRQYEDYKKLEKSPADSEDDLAYHVFSNCAARIENEGEILEKAEKNLKGHTAIYDRIARTYVNPAWEKFYQAILKINEDTEFIKTVYENRFDCKPEKLSEIYSILKKQRDNLEAIKKFNSDSQRTPTRKLLEGINNYNSALRQLDIIITAEKDAFPCEDTKIFIERKEMSGINPVSMKEVFDSYQKAKKEFSDANKKCKYVLLKPSENAVYLVSDDLNSSVKIPYNDSRFGRLMLKEYAVSSQVQQA